MKRKIIVATVLTSFLVVCMLIFDLNQPNSFSSLAQEDNTISDIAVWMEPYGTYRLSSQIHKQMHQLFSPITVNCGEVTVTLAELLYDGEWMYTAAKIVPNDADKVLVLPGSAAQPDDPVCGINREHEREDTRTFLEAAKKDRKQLLAVYAYPKEFDTLGAYFLDYFQRRQDVSVLLSGAQLAGGNHPANITWLIQIYDVDLDTQQFTLVKEVASEPMKVLPMQELIHYSYQVVSENASFATVELIESALHTYIRPDWNQSEQTTVHFLTLWDENGNAYPQGASPDLNTAVMSFYPEKLYLSIDDDSELIALVRLEK